MSGSTPPLPETIGPYRVLQLLGQGGMGVVYEAEETEPVRRRVAVKVIRRGQTAADVLARFDAERQALAMMSHPGIAKVLRAGATDAGEPWFSMEMVRGLPLNEFCDRDRLSIEDRLRLFIDVCRAVQHAHQKSVVHRDLKPSNVLVSDSDGIRQVKVIDFGVAKALGQQLTEMALVTLAGTAIGTAAYMSPEQADTTGVDIDTRSDIYSLGVMLFELLIGELPVDPSIRGVHAHLAQIASRLTTPPTPSSRLRDSGQSSGVAHARRTDLRSLHRDLKGDLDWIVMMAMQPDRALRYESAAALADDLERFLRNEPVSARPPSTRYRVAKFVKRHRRGVLGAGITALALLAAAIVAAVGFVRAVRAERLAANEAAAARQVTDFLVGLFSANVPAQARRDSLTARDILVRGAERATKELASQPVLQARLLQSLGMVHRQMGYYDDAQRLLDEALKLREQQLGPRDTAVASTWRELAEVMRLKGDLKAADSAVHRALRIRETAGNREGADYLSALSALGGLRLSQGRPADAESLFTVLVALDNRLRPQAESIRARAISNLGVAVFQQGRGATADSLFHVALALQEHALGTEHAEAGRTLNNLGGNAYEMRRYPEALGYYQRAQLIFDRTLPPTHATSIGLRNNIGEVFWKLGRNDEAEPLLREALAAKEKTLVLTSPSIANTLHALAGVLRDKGRYREAEPLYTRALAIREPRAATNPRETAETLRDYAELMKRTNRAAQSAKLVARADSLAPAK